MMRRRDSYLVTRSRDPQARSFPLPASLRAKHAPAGAMAAPFDTGRQHRPDQHDAPNARVIRRDCPDTWEPAQATIGGEFEPIHVEPGHETMRLFQPAPDVMPGQTILPTR